MAGPADDPNVRRTSAPAKFYPPVNRVSARYPYEKDPPTQDDSCHATPENPRYPYKHLDQEVPHPKPSVNVEEPKVPDPDFEPTHGLKEGDLEAGGGSATSPTKESDAPPPKPESGIKRLVWEYRQKVSKNWHGADPFSFLLCVVVFLIIRYGVTKPASISVNAWQLLATFVATILALIVEPLPVGACAWVAQTFILVSKTLEFVPAFQSFTNDTIWLIVAAYMFAKAIDKSGLGDRIANIGVYYLGKTSLGLAYGLGLAETALSPAMPSTTARAGGVFVPIIISLAHNANSYPGNESAQILGAFLMMSQFQFSINTSAMFATGAAQNSLAISIARDAGVDMSGEWVTWIKGAFVPAFIAGVVTPLIVYFLAPPKLKKTPDAPLAAAAKLKSLGRIKFSEGFTMAVLVCAIGLWISGRFFGISGVTTAMLGISALLLFGILTWKDVLAYGPAWDTLFWFAVLIGMATNLDKQGVIKHFADRLAAKINSMGFGMLANYWTLSLAYFLIHYLFASQTAHVAALYGSFLRTMLALKIPPKLAAYGLAYTTNLFGTITHYASGQAAAYYGAGYLKVPTIFYLGAVISVWNLLIWLFLGVGWMKVVGFFAMPS
eukprot:jgi/Botrbrau1/8063/Bobra.13_2s0032.1